MRKFAVAALTSLPMLVGVAGAMAATSGDALAAWGPKCRGLQVDGSMGKIVANVCLTVKSGNRNAVVQVRDLVPPDMVIISVDGKETYTLHRNDPGFAINGPFKRIGIRAVDASGNGGEWKKGPEQIKYYA